MTDDFCYHVAILRFYSDLFPWFQSRVPFIFKDFTEERGQEKSEWKKFNRSSICEDENRPRVA